MEKFLANLPHLSLVGDFHSHTGWGDLKGVGNLSTQDEADMAPGNLYLIIISRDDPQLCHIREIRYAIFRTFENAVLKLDSDFVNEPYSKPEDCDE